MARTVTGPGRAAYRRELGAFGRDWQRPFGRLLSGMRHRFKWMVR